MPPKQKPGRSKQNYGTPPEFIQAVLSRLRADAKFGMLDPSDGFYWDIAASSANSIAPRWYAEEDDALAQPWHLAIPSHRWGWLNPPFARIGPWAEAAYDRSRNGAHIAMLIPAAVGANWWRDFVDGKARVLQLNGRITFVGETDPYPKDCALLLYGPDQRPGYEVWSWMNDLTDKEKDMAKKRTAKPKKKPTAKVTRGKFAATTKAGKKAEQIAAARATKPKKANGKVTHEGGNKERFPSRRVTVIAPNGSSSRDPLPEPTPLDLGPILLPEPDDAVKVLKELATLNDQAQQAKKVYEDLKDRTKTAKEKYDDLADMVLTRLRVTTHKSDLPLFDERTEDQTRMETAGKLVVAAPAEPLGDDLPAGDVFIPRPAPDAVETLQDEEIPF